ncbi:unnamed protein product [Brassica napus]|uniref:(rape) hypothetical protein n=1 Tax=Brassica napus TaxID=3708 RepID=A0A816KA84_BRANA|nr:unnamed protein product [Brassica napus]
MIKNDMCPKEDAARLCVEALGVIPPIGLITIFFLYFYELAVSDWEGQLMKVMQRQGEKK